MNKLPLVVTILFAAALAAPVHADPARAVATPIRAVQRMQAPARDAGKARGIKAKGTKAKGTRAKGTRATAIRAAAMSSRTTRIPTSS